MTDPIKAQIDRLFASDKSIMDTLYSEPLPPEYRPFVDRERLFLALGTDPRFYPRLMQEMRAKLTAMGRDPDDKSLEKDMHRKDGPRRFSKFLEERNQARDNSPAFLTGSSFEEKAEQYKALLTHVEGLWSTASVTFLHENYPLAAFLAILTIEEIGKLSHIHEELTLFDVAKPAPSAELLNKSHRKKHFIAVVAGALVNSRLDRVLGKGVVKKLLHEAESDELEKTRQASLYVDHVNGLTQIPSQSIDRERAQVLTVLAGELMAEVMGHYPFDFERMHKSVVDFERTIGMPENKTNPK